MDDFTGSTDDSAFETELSGVLLNSVMAVRSEPVVEDEVAAALEQVRLLGTSSIQCRIRVLRRRFVGAAVAVALLLAMFVWREFQTDAWADVVEAVQSKPWIHGVAKEKNGQSHEFWFSSVRKVSASRRGENVQYDDHRLAIRHKFDPKENRLYRVPQTSNSAEGFQAFTTMFGGIFRGDEALTSGPPNMDIVEQSKRRVSENGREWIEYELTLRPHSGVHDDVELAEMVIRVDAETLLPDRMSLASVNKKRPESVEFQLDYPKTGPNDVYDLGVARSVEIVDRVPKDDLARLIAGTKAGLERFDDYQALELKVLAVDSEEPIGDLRRLPTLYRVFRKGRRWRIEWGQYLVDSGWPTAPEPNADMHQWIKGYARHHRFTPMSICDGTTIYRARFVWPEGAKFQQVEGWEVKRRLDPNGGIEEGRRDSTWAYRPEFYAYPTLPIGQHVSTKVIANPDSGPTDTVLVECAFTTDQGLNAARASRFWIDPSRSFVAMRREDEFGDDESGPYIIEELAETPRGLWYPTIMRWKVGRIRDGRPPVYDQIRHFYLDFKTEMPDSLFRP
jgi:hypothetical protein